MECSCEIDVDCSEGDPIQCHSSERRTARKHHKCNECYRQVAPGEQYEEVKFLCEGSWFRHKTCSDCLSLREQFVPHSFYYECVRSEIEEFINAEQGDIPESCIADLTPAARAFVCEKIEATWENYFKDGV